MASNAQFLKTSALVGILAPVFLLATAPAQAQDAGAITNPGAAPAAAAPADNPDNAIIVTGTRIVRPDLVAASPVSTISAQAIKLNNAVTLEQILQSNPQFIPSGNAASNNPGDGAATIDLRGLGANRTLVLIDGKRAPYYDTNGQVDINTIPVALIKRIDVLTGGASAVYGSDAIAGVVNFILDDRFVGFRADASSQVTKYGDGSQYDGSLTAGFKLGDRGNFVVSGGYSKRDPVKYGARKESAQILDSGDLVTSAGSSNAVPTVFDTGDGQLQVTPSGALSSDLQLYNFNPVNYAQTPLERYNAMALLRYDVTDGIEFYARGNFEHTKVETNLAPTATAGYTFNIDPSNPFLTDGERATFFDSTATLNDGTGVADDPTARAGTSVVGIRRRIVETGGRTEIHTTNSWQVLAGLRGDLSNNWNWDVSAQYGHTKRHEVLENDLSYSALQNALDVVTGPDGNPICHSTLTDPTNGCVPLNLFNVGTIPQTQLAYVLRNAIQNTLSTEFIASASIGGNLSFLQSPFADAPAAVSIGAEYRREKAVTTVSPNYASGDLIYYGQGQNIGGKYNVKEAYIEFKMPLVQDKPFIKALDLESGFRYSDYSTAGTVFTYKGGGDWSPVEGVRFRGIYQRAVRAPNINELYSPVVGGTGSLNNDPCGTGNSISAALEAVCIAQGAPAGKFANGTSTIDQPISGQINVFTGGNPNLKAEKSDTFTVGVVITPPRVRGFSVTVDYYNIRIANAIDTVAPFITANQCYNVDVDATSAACSSIHRNTLTGTLSGNLQFGVPETLGNIDVIKTNGIDLGVNYHGGMSDGFNYAVAFNGTYTRSYDKAGTECAGRFGAACDIEPISKWKHVADLTLGYKNVSATTRWRFLSSVKEDVGTDILKSKIPSYSYFDETISVNIEKKFTLRLGMQNVFNKRPPVVGGTVGNDFNAGETFPVVYDLLGRTFFAGITANF